MTTPLPPTTDLATPEHVAELVRRFYGDVAQDSLLGHLFNDVAKVDWSEHIPILTAFWCRALFSMPGYSGNPFRQHALIHKQSNFTVEHFERWLELFHETVELGWVGPNADKVRALARNVARVHSTQLLGHALDVARFEDSRW